MNLLPWQGSKGRGFKPAHLVTEENSSIWVIFCGRWGCCVEKVLMTKESGKAHLLGDQCEDSYHFGQLEQGSDCGGQGKSQKSSQNQLDTGNEAQTARKIGISHSVSVLHLLEKLFKYVEWNLQSLNKIPVTYIRKTFQKWVVISGCDLEWRPSQQGEVLAEGGPLMVGFHTIGQHGGIWAITRVDFS